MIEAGQRGGQKLIVTRFNIGISDKTRYQDAMLTPNNLRIHSSRQGDFYKACISLVRSNKLTSFQAEGIWLLDVFKSASQQVPILALVEAHD